MSQAGKIATAAPVTPTTITGTNGIVVTGGPAYNISDDRFYTKYVVSPTAGEGEFTTIGAAITQAVTDGATNTNRKVVLVKYATYNENLSLSSPGIDIIGIGAPGFKTTNLLTETGQVRYPKLQGTITFSQTGTNSVSYLTITPSSGDCITCNTAASINFITQCFLNQNVAATNLFTHTNGTSYLFECNLTSNSTEALNLNISGGTVQTRNCNDSSVASTTGYNKISGGSYSDYASTFDAGFQVSAGGANFLQSSIGDSGNNAGGCIKMTGGTVVVQDVNFNNSSTTASAISGTAGTLTFISSSSQVSVNGTNTAPYSSLTGATIILGTSSASNFQFTGGFGQTTRVVSSFPLTLTVGDYYISAQGSGARTINMPASTNRYTGQTFVVKDAAANSAANNITVSGNGVNIIGPTSAATYVINTNGAAINLTYNGTAWEVF